jgi:hypothetical protein
MKEKRKKSNKKIFALLAFAVLAVALAGGLIARYVRTFRGSDRQAVAEDFYFIAELLGDDKMEPVGSGSGEETYAFPEEQSDEWYLYGPAGHEITIKLSNYSDNYRITKKDITYQAEVEIEAPSGTAPESLNTWKNRISLTKTESIGGAGASAGSGDATVSSTGTSSGTLTLSGNMDGSTKSQDTLSLTIPDCNSNSGGTDIPDGTKVTLILTSKSPYEKTIKLAFILCREKEEVKYQVVDSVGRRYAELILMTDKAIEKDKLTLQWSKNLSIDNTDPLTYTYNQKSGKFTPSAGIEDRKMAISQTLKEDQSESIYFFKSDTNLDYSTNGTVTVNSADGTYTISITDPAINTDVNSEKEEETKQGQESKEGGAQ